MKRYKLYLFDFDGTLFDTFPALEYTFERSYEEIGIQINKEDCKQYSREPLPDSYQRLGADMDHFWDFVAIINRYLNSKESVELTRLYDDTLEFHKYVKDNNIAIGIVTSNNIPHIKEIYENKGIDYSHFVVFVGNQEAQTPKPDPLPILTALQLVKYDGDLKDVVYVGDSPNDSLAAERAGIDNYLLDRYHEFSDQPYKIIYSLMDLFKE